MKRLIPIFSSCWFLILGCTSPSEKENIAGCGELGYYPDSCSSDFQFKIEISGGLSYVYQSENRKIKKLINPFVAPRIYADTFINLTEKERCLVFERMKSVDVLKYSSPYKPAREGEMDPEPEYNLQFQFNGTTKEIHWAENTELINCSEAQKLKELILLIDSLLVYKPEFSNLPKSEFEWL